MTARSPQKKLKGLAHRIFPKSASVSALQKKFELPMLFLTFVWLIVLVAELVYGSNPALSVIGTITWGLFILYFCVRLVAIQSRVYFFKKNWIFVLAILVSLLRFFPLLQSFPLVRALTATFGMQVIWIFVSVDQGMRSVRRYLGRRGVGYALALTFVVIFAGAAGMMHFENISGDEQGLQTFPRALWWAAMQMTNIGSAYAIKTTGGRIVCLAISVYAAAMFGYLTALFATFFIDRETKASMADITRQESLERIQEELIQLRNLIEDRGVGLSDKTRKKHGDLHSRKKSS